MHTADELRSIIRRPIEETKLGGYDIPTPKGLYQKTVPRKRHEIDEAWVKGIRKWWKAVTSKGKNYKGRPKDKYSKVGTWDELAKAADDSIAYLWSVRSDIESLRTDLLMVKGFWDRSAFDDSSNLTAAQKRRLKKSDPELLQLKKELEKEDQEKKKPTKKVVQEIDAAIDAIDEAISSARDYKNGSHPEGIYSPGGVPLFREVFDNPKEYSRMMRSLSISVDEGLSKATKAISGRLLKMLSSLVKKKGSATTGRYSPSKKGDVPEQVVHVGKVALVFQDVSQDPRDTKVYRSMPIRVDGKMYQHDFQSEKLGLNPKERKVLIDQLKKAQALLRKKGVSFLWYGDFVKLPPGTFGQVFGTDNPSKGRATASYNRATDQVHIYGNYTGADTIVHELGHRYYYKFLSNAERAQFKKWFGKVKAPSAYGGTNEVEEFAELFSGHVVGAHTSKHSRIILDREQRNRFANFLGKKQRLEWKDSEEAIMASVEELRSIIRRPMNEGMPKAMAFAVGMFDKQQAEADKVVSVEMKKLAKRYVSVLQGITGVKNGWSVDSSTDLLSLDNEEAGIVIDIHWEVDVGTGKADITVELNKRKGPEGPGAKWKSKFHLVKGVKPTPMTLSPTSIITDSAVRRFLKENAEALLTSLTEEDGWVEVTEAQMNRKKLERAIYKAMPAGNKGTYKEVDGRKVKAPMKSGGRQTIMFTGDLARKSGFKNSSSKALADLSDDELSKIAQIMGIAEEDGMNEIEQVRDIMERKGTPYGKGGASKEADLTNWEKKHVRMGKGETKAIKKAAAKGERRAGKKEIQARMRGEDDENASYAAQLRGLIERKGRAHEKSTTPGTEAGYNKDERRGDARAMKAGETYKKPWQQKSKGSKGHGKKAHARSVRRSKKKEIEAGMRGEGAEPTLDTLGQYLELLGIEHEDELGEAMASPMSGQMDALADVQSTAEQLGRFASEFASYLKKGMRSGKVDVRKLGDFGRRVDAAHSIMKRNYRTLAFEEVEADVTEDDLTELEEAMAIGASAYEVPSPVPFAKKMTTGSRRKWRKVWRKSGLPIGAQEMLIELATISSSLPAADRKLVDKMMNMTWYGSENLGARPDGPGMVDAIKKLHKKIFGRIRKTKGGKTQSGPRIGAGANLEWNKIIDALDPALMKTGASVKRFGSEGRMISAHDPDWRLEVVFLPATQTYKFSLFSGFGRNGSDLVKASISHEMGGLEDAVKMAKDFSRAILKNFG